MGGSSRLAKRMQTSTHLASSLALMLDGGSLDTRREDSKWLIELTSSNSSVQQIIDTVVNRLAPETGNLDEESCRDSLAKALTDALEKNEELDLGDLSKEEVKKIVGNFLSYEAYNRLMLDIGQMFERSNISPVQSVRLRKEIREYLKAELERQLQKCWTDSDLTPKQMNEVMQKTVENTFKVYEDEL